MSRHAVVAIVVLGCFLAAAIVAVAVLAVRLADEEGDAAAVDRQEHPLLNRTVHELGLNMVDFVLGYGVGGDTLYYLRGEHLKYSELPTKAPYKLPDKSRIDFNTLLWEVFDNFTTSEYSGNEKLLPENRQKIKSLDGIELTMQSRRLFDAKYLDTETVQYISDASSFKNEHSELSAANWLPISGPSLPSGPNPVPKTVQQGFQAIPGTMVQQFLDASSANRFHRNHHLRSIFENEDGNYVLTFQPTETQAGVTSDDKSASTKRACAKKVVLAIPKLALQHLDWKGLKEDTVKDMLDNAVRSPDTEDTSVPETSMVLQLARCKTPNCGPFDTGVFILSATTAAATATPIL